jgi:hypothetical protein
MAKNFVLQYVGGHHFSDNKVMLNVEMMSRLIEEKVKIGLVSTQSRRRMNSQKVKVNKYKQK